MQFLHASVHCRGTEIVALPKVPNVAFCLGVQEWPQVARCPPWLDQARSPLQVLRTWITPHLHSFAGLVRDLRPERYKSHLAALLLECLFAGWGTRAIQVCIHSVSHKHDDRFWATVRRVAVATKNPETWGFLHDACSRLLESGARTRWRGELADGRRAAIERARAR